ncbi:sulfate adenylyltransferase subunit CysN [Cesiribacter andamanensis]|uniref:Sulfate adenylyltransferase subunit 1 n=1 Tax=Cesiribacter andamanensis AMV16 TaxID=1279009 RepID=M7P100_9BACT|nr:sulfate adenylyltransferase subunit CysN [Cesiribacter andamanensis]EMR04254.1 Bifunctional enzyme CysN/CysC [Cesiribacter andamanensis AMV16]
MDSPIDTNRYLTMDLLRFTTAGSVDDGKSTLIGRLLYDSKAIFEDQIEAIERSSKQRGTEYVDLSLLTDGLRAEREQGITIDVAYRYFATPRRKFIIADTPGHIQYTRNMVTGASTANLAIVLVDARHGVVEQTRRHAFIASLLQIKHLVLAVNKMDLVDWSEERFEAIRKEFAEFSSRLNIADIRFIPISALKGDNVVEPSQNMPWFKGATLLYTLETVNIGNDHNHVDSRFPVQYVIRPQSDKWHDYRGYAGRIAGGVFKPGDEVVALPSGFSSKIQRIDTHEGPIDEAFAPMSVTITLEDDIDISRGDMLVKPNNQPQSGQDLELMICWLNQKPLQPKGKYILMHTTKTCKCIVKEVRYKVNINTLHKIEDDLTLGLNEIGRISLRTTEPLFFDPYTRNRSTGSLILIDQFTNETVGAGMII